MLRILADENMSGLEVFSRFGEVKMCAGRTLTADDLKATDVLLVRSVTRVNQALLEGTPVRFVGSATIGTDHVDQAWLRQSGIAFAHAPGCNAQAVVEYVLQAILLWCEKQGRAPAGLSLGIVGVGNVGARLAAHAAALGMTVVPCDPPRARSGDQLDWPWASLTSALACDVISLHVPLNRSGDDNTWHLLAEQELQTLHAGQLLINTCRGSVIDNQALLARLDQVSAPTCVLDVWEDEPSVPAGLFAKVWLGSPHIAGYSLEGKLRGSWMLYQSLGRWLGESLDMPPLPEAGSLALTINGWPSILHLLRQLYRIEEDHQRLEASLASVDAALAFDRLRKDYPLRHEVGAWRLEGVRPPAWQALLGLLGGTASAC